VGLATGALIGGGYGYGYGYPYYGDDYAYYGDDDYDGDAYAAAPDYSGGDAQSCAMRYRSYDPASGTYLGYDGIRHPCP
jgi:BA14K-like protein